MATRQPARRSAKRPAAAGPATSATGPAASGGKSARGATGTMSSRPAKVSPGKSSAGTRGAGNGPVAKNGQKATAQADKSRQSTVARLSGAGSAIVRWAGGGVSLTALIVSVLGLADSAYLTYQHFSESTTFAGCSETGGVNCVAVTTSAWSHVGPFPVSVLGLAFFAFMVAANSPWGWRAPWPAVHWARLGSVIVGIAFVLYLIWAELFRINAICLYCTGVHVLTFMLFALIIGRAAYSGVRAIDNQD